MNRFKRFLLVIGVLCLPALLMWLQSTKIYAYGVDIAPYILIPGSILFMAYVFVFVFDAPTARQEQTTSPNTVGVSLGTRTAAYNLKQTH